MMTLGARMTPLVIRMTIVSDATTGSVIYNHYLYKAGHRFGVDIMTRVDGCWDNQQMSYTQMNIGPKLKKVKVATTGPAARFKV
jgi:hypothetical protein